MDSTIANPEIRSFVEILEHLGIAAALDGFIAPERVRRWGFNDIERFVVENGYRFVRENGNLYGRLMLVPLKPVAPAPVLRVITRSDHAAVYPSRRAA